MLEKSEKLATANDEDFSFQTLLGLVDAALEYDGVNEVHVPSWGLDSDEIWKNGIVLAKNDPQRIVVAVPCTYDGIKAANALVTDGARVQISGVFAPHQALLAAAIGASYVAPTFGKMYDAGRDGFKGTEEMMKTITKCGSESKVLVKNVRSAVDVANLGSIGCDTFAISAEVCEDMFSDSLTTQYDKELNFTVARIGEKQRELKIEAQKQKLLEMEKQSMPVQDDPESEGGENDPESVGAATRRASATIATPMATPSPSQPSDGSVSKPKPKSNNIISLEEMPKNVFVENDFDDVDASSSDGSSPTRQSSSIPTISTGKMSIRKMRFYACVPTKKDFICPKQNTKKRASKSIETLLTHLDMSARSPSHSRVSSFRGSAVLASSGRRVSSRCRRASLASPVASTSKTLSPPLEKKCVTSPERSVVCSRSTRAS